jgi:hypothetical protein
VSCVSTQVLISSVPVIQSLFCVADNPFQLGGNGPCPSVTPSSNDPPRKHTRWSCLACIFQSLRSVSNHISCLELSLTSSASPGLALVRALRCKASYWQAFVERGFYASCPWLDRTSAPLFRGGNGLKGKHIPRDKPTLPDSRGL